MQSAARRLVDLAGPALAAWPAVDFVLDRGLIALLKERNGFYAFESALHVFPVGVPPAGYGLEAWNDDGLWRSSYADRADGLLFFAEDVFGGQFALREGQVVSFDPETGESRHLAHDVNTWANAVMIDLALLTGYPVGHWWQEANGPLHAGERLVPIQPFVLGGAFATDNLQRMEAAQGMRLRGELAAQIALHPDGTNIRYRVGN